MSEFLKPQSPLQHRDGAYVYPLTTTDQIILEDNTRLNATLDKVAYMGEKNQGAATEIINADTLGGRLPSYYAKTTKLTPRNLLDNSDFTNPVNQRGQTSYTSVSYGIDRWKTNMGGNMTVTVGNDKVTLSKANGAGDFMQVLPFDLTGKTVTYAIKTGGGITLKSAVVASSSSLIQIDGLKAYLGVYATNNTTVFRIYFNDASEITLDLYWAALYEGEYTAENLPEYQSKGYGAELAECQRYYLQFGQVNAFGFVSSSAKSYYMTIQTPVPMRAMPTKVTMSGYVARVATGYSVRTSGDFTAPESLSIWNTSPYLQGQITVIDTIATAVDTNNSSMTFMIRDLTLSADL